MSIIICVLGIHNTILSSLVSATPNLKKARSDFGKVLEHVNECETKENLFPLGEVHATLNGDTQFKSNAQRLKVSILQAK
jgi:hypothetical protein